MEVAWLHPRNSLTLITFTRDEAKWLHQPHFNALVVDLEIERHLVKQNLIENKSSMEIFFA